MNIFQEAKSILDKNGKVNALGPMGNQKLTGREISAYFRRNKVKDKDIRKAVEVALDLGGSMTIAYKEIKKFYGNKIAKSKEVSAALKWANEEHHQSKDKPHAHEIDESKMGDLLIDIQQGANAKELARDFKISPAVAKAFLADYYSSRGKPSKAPGKGKLKKEEFELTEGEIGDIENLMKKGMNAKQIGKKKGYSPRRIKALTGMMQLMKQLQQSESVQEVTVGDAGIRKDFPNVWKTKDKKLYNTLRGMVNAHGFTTNLKAYKKNPKKFIAMLKGRGNPSYHLPNGESVEEGKFTNIFEAESVIDVAANIVKTKGAAKFKGVLIDLYTASLITNIYGKVNDTNKAKMEKLPLDKLVKVVYKIAGMKEEQQAIIANQYFEQIGTKPRVQEVDKRTEKVEGMYRNMVDMWSQEPKVIEASLPIVEAPVLPSTQAGVPSFDYSIQVGVDKYVAEINKQLHSGRFAKLHKEKKTEMKARKATKYYRVEEWEMGRAGSIHAFIDIATGDIFKPAGWKAPAKGARGNIRDQNYIKYISKYPDAYYGGHLYK